jgi:E3 ubiquitin-protein ligase DOA10
MKQSDSTNSLTALTEVVSETECFICLELQNDLNEPLVDSKLLRTCGCIFVVHPACWNTWMKKKSDWDCPLCHKRSLSQTLVPNPILFAVQQREIERTVAPSRFNLLLFLALLFLLGLIFLTTILLTKPKK